MKTLIITICCLIFFVLGYYIGNTSNKIKDYNVGIVSFCELNEEDRLKICPYMRIHETFEQGYSITYICNNKFSQVYVKLVDLLKEKQKFLQKIKEKEHKIFAKKLCEDKDGEIYKLQVR